MLIYTHRYTYIHAYRHTYIYVHIYVYTYMYIYVYTLAPPPPKIHSCSVSKEFSTFSDFQRSRPKTLDFPISKFADFQPQGSRFPSLQVSSPKALDFQISRALGLEICELGNLEPWGWKYGSSKCFLNHILIKSFIWTSWREIYQELSGLIDLKICSCFKKDFNKEFVSSNVGKYNKN